MSNNTYYKAVRQDGTDFHTGTVRWAPPAGHDGEWIVLHPTAPTVGDYASEYLSVSTVVTDCTGMKWPCRLLTVEAIGDVIKPSPVLLPSKRAGVAFRVTGELPAYEVFGPQDACVAALIDRALRLTLALAPGLDNVALVAWNAAWDAARDAARDVVWATVVEDDESISGLFAVLGAVGALVVRDLITTEDYDTLTRPWREVIGPIHPDDPELFD